MMQNGISQIEAAVCGARSERGYAYQQQPNAYNATSSALHVYQSSPKWVE